jgi:DNA-directed RNA polymerase subunit RPC12/RpoP
VELEYNLAVRKENKLRVFEKRVLRKILVRCVEFTHEELYNNRCKYCQSRRMRKVVLVTHMKDNTEA